MSESCTAEKLTTSMEHLVGVTLGSLRGQFGIIWGSRWDHFRSLWDHFGITLASFLGHVGITLGSFWDEFGLDLKSFCNEFGLIWGPNKNRIWGTNKIESPGISQSDFSTGWLYNNWVAYETAVWFEGPLLFLAGGGCYFLIWDGFFNAF